jgi:hypothetical protein
MTYIIKAIKVQSAGKSPSIRQTQNRGTISQEKVKSLKKHTSSDKKYIKSESKKESVIKSVGGVKTEFIEGAVYAISVIFFGTKEEILHPGLTIGEIKNLSSYVVMPEESASFYDTIVAHSAFIEHDPSTPSNPSGTITLAQFKVMVSTTKHFPDLKNVVNGGKGRKSALENYIKTTWLPDNLPGDVPSILQSQINIL